jgi:hypothetical protein
MFYESCVRRAVLYGIMRCLFRFFLTGVIIPVSLYLQARLASRALVQ